MSAATPSGIDMTWLALTLSARSLARELAHHVDDEGWLPLRSEALVDAAALGNELARLLCAHPHERIRVRRDVLSLLDHDAIVVDEEGIRLCVFDSPAPVPVETTRVASTSKDRMRRLRQRQQESQRDAVAASHVTPAAVTGDAPRDVGDASRALSLENKLDLNTKRESAREARKRTIAPDLALTEGRRARALGLGIGDDDTDLVWMAFVAYYVAAATTSADWDATWTTWVVREVAWRKRNGEASPPETRGGPNVQRADLKAPWLLKAMGEK